MNHEQAAEAMDAEVKRLRDALTMIYHQANGARPSEWGLCLAAVESRAKATLEGQVDCHDQARAQTEKQRDELTVALQRIADGQEMTGQFTHADTVMRYQEIARAALAATKGHNVEADTQATDAAKRRRPAGHGRSG